MQSTQGFIYFLRVVWIIAFFHGEFFTYWISARRCAPWPNGNTPNSPSFQQRGLDRLLLISDPRMTNAYSYDSPGFLLPIAEFYNDLYMDRNYRHLDHALDPHGTVFLGDLIEGGRMWDDEGWKRQATRFRHLFRSAKSQFFIAGNHDIGYGDGIKAHVLDRFQSKFGPTSYTIETNHYSIVVLDTLSLASTYFNTSSKQQALEQLLAPPTRPATTLLMTHVPLYRPPGTFCNDGRNDEITQDKGRQYKTLVDEQWTSEILNRIKPSAVFSGDHQKYCLIHHHEHGGIPEITVPTFSMAQGQRYPGVVLLDLESESFSTKVCWLSDQTAILFGYGYLSLATLAALGVFHGCHLLKNQDVVINKPTKLDSNVHEDNDWRLVSQEKSAPVVIMVTPHEQEDIEKEQRISPLRQWLKAVGHSFSEVASVCLIVYIVCLICV
ncbi:Metallo-dependent phosphatase-like protein [Dichotomocladium elegans]|nr:Metallo-dependent phosphatase-like protein [Dichotomocladium elegans]